MELTFKIKNYDGKEYIFFPACAYNGNRFKSLKKSYPPRLLEEERGKDIEIMITDVPRLEPDGSGAIEVTTGDVAVPCMGMFSKERKEGLLIFTHQQLNGKNMGLSFSNGEFKITSPARRSKVYVWPFMHENKIEETAEDYTEKPEYKVLEFPCESMEEFYSVFFKNRKIMGDDCSRPKNLTYQQQWEIQRKKFNTLNCNPKWGYVHNIDQRLFILGWVGTLQIGYVMMKLGNENEWKTAEKTLDSLFEIQSDSGLFPSKIDKDGNYIGDYYKEKDTENYLLIRRPCDVLYTLIKTFELYNERNKEIPEKYIAGTKKLADAIINVWEKNGQLGQFVDFETLEVRIGNSTCGALAPAALAKAGEYFGEEKYIKYAEEIAQYYYNKDIKNGYSTGGPGEILQGPDSESAFSFLESAVVLYEVTKDKKWLSIAEFAAHYCSSWVVSYNYKFPETSEFYRLDIKTTGTIFANVQNKHSAPGICTMSGDSLYKLYKFTGNELYKELITDIKEAISQCMSTKERPIYDWGLPIDPTLHPDCEPTTPKMLPEGYICERVNMSDWETERCIGGVFCASCWCETSNLLTLAELPENI